MQGREWLRQAQPATESSGDVSPADEEYMRTGIFTVTAGDESLKLAVSANGEVRVQPGDTTLQVAAAGPDTYRVTSGLASWTVIVVGDGDERQAFVDGQVFTLDARPGDVRIRRSRAHAELVAAPMPAKVTAILVKVGDQVARGDLLITLEAMKMELPLYAPRDGTVASISCAQGDLVQPGVRLLELSA